MESVAQCIRFDEHARLAPRPPDLTAVARVVPLRPDLALGALAALHHISAAEIEVTKTGFCWCLFGTVSNPFRGSTRSF
jgi:hypothetical protein